MVYGVAQGLTNAIVFPGDRPAKVRDVRCALTKSSPSLCFEKARLYLAGYEFIEHSLPARTHLQRKLSQIRGRLVRAKTKSPDQVCRDGCDLISTRGSKNGNRIERPSICQPTTAPNQISSRRPFTEAWQSFRGVVNPSPAAGSRRARGLGPMIADERRDSRPALRNQALSQRVVSATTAAQREYRWARGKAQSCHNESALKPRSSVISVWRFK
jgi:hypothetical protein